MLSLPFLWAADSRRAAGEGMAQKHDKRKNGPGWGRGVIEMVIQLPLALPRQRGSPDLIRGPAKNQDCPVVWRRLFSPLWVFSFSRGPPVVHGSNTPKYVLIQEAI